MGSNKYKKFDRRIKILQALFVMFVVLFSLYLFAIQIIDFGNYKEKSKQREKKLFVLRGEIIDRNGFKLASDVTTYKLWAHPEFYAGHSREIAEFLSPIMKTPASVIDIKLNKKSHGVILVDSDIDQKGMELIKAKYFRELSLEPKNRRIYPQGVLASHILGYYNPNADIAAGIEQIAKDSLKYYDKSISFEKTRDGRIIYNLSTNPEVLLSPVKGKTLQLTIDSAIQHICEKFLYKRVKETNAKRGAVIVLEPKSGEILALAMYPYYDPNEYSKYSFKELKNWAISDVYPPGSTFKIITVACGFISGKINKYSRIQDTGKIRIGWHEVKNYDYKKIPYPGMIDLTYLFLHSSNVGSVKIAEMMPRQEHYDILKMFNFGARTGIDLPGESSGLLSSPRHWDGSTQGSMGYGYGASVTAMQMAAAVNAIANKGVWVTPHVIKYSEDEAESKVVQRRVMTEAQARDITDLLVASVEKGRSVVKMNDFKIAAKTGTSLKPKENGKGYTNQSYTSMIGFFPASDPKVLIYVILDSPQGGGVWGSTVAAPVFRDIAVEITKILNFAPDKNIGEKKNGTN